MGKRGINFIGLAALQWLQASKSVVQNDAYGQMIQANDTSLYNAISANTGLWNDSFVNSLDYLDWAYARFNEWGITWVRDFLMPRYMYNIFATGSKTTPITTAGLDAAGWDTVDRVLYLCNLYGMKIIFYAPDLWMTNAAWSGATQDQITDNLKVPFFQYFCNRYSAYAGIIEISPSGEEAGNAGMVYRQMRVYDTIKAITPQMKVQAISGLRPSNVVTFLGQLQTAGYQNKFDDTVGFSYYEEYYNSDDQPDPYDVYPNVNNNIASCMNLAGRSDYKVMISEFGIFWKPGVDAPIGSTQNYNGASPTCISDMFNRIVSDANCVGACYWAASGRTVTTGVHAFVGQQGMGLWEVESNPRVTHYPTWTAWVAFSSSPSASPSSSISASPSHTGLYLRTISGTPVTLRKIDGTPISLESL